jgi:DNA-binding response OmpR family regulator
MRVLIAVADPALAQIVCRALRSDALVAELASDLEDLLVRIAALPYDALILDLALPGARGPEIVRHVRHQRHAPPILALCTGPDPAERIAALRAGADDCVTPPPGLDELAARVHALARRAGRQSGECLEIDDLVLHVAKRHAFRAGRPLALTPREFVALEYLVRQHGRPVPAEELLGILWEGDEAPAENFVAVLMMRLRKKVDDGHAARLLTTIRGVGYVVAIPAT